MRTFSNKIFALGLSGVVSLTSVCTFGGDYSDSLDPNSISPNSINPDTFKNKKVDYGKLCEAITKSRDAVYKDDKIGGQEGMPAGITARDYCTARGIATGMPSAHPLADPSSVPGSLPTGGRTWMQGNNFCTLATPPDGSCPGRVMMCQDQNGNTTSQETCEQAKNHVNACKFAKLGEDKQVLTYCKAREQAMKSRKGLIAMASLDTAAAAICLVDAHMTYDASKYMCGSAAMGVGAAELGYTIGMSIKDSKDHQYRVGKDGSLNDTSKGTMNGIGIASRVLASTTGIVLGEQILQQKCEKNTPEARMKADRKFSKEHPVDEIKPLPAEPLKTNFEPIKIDLQKR